MLSIVDTFSRRLIHILKLLSETNDWLTIKEIAEILHVSEKTISDDLKIIKKDFGNKIVIESSLHKGIRVEDFPVNIFLEFQAEILIESVAIKFIIELLKHPGNDLNYYSDSIHVSRSTLYRQLPIINEFLNTYGIHIESQRSFYTLKTDDEYSCRRFFSTFLFEVYKYKTFPFINSEWNKFYKDRILYIYTKNNEHISDLQIAYYSMFYHFSILRESSEYRLNNNTNSLGKKIPFTNEQLVFLNQHTQLSHKILLNIESSIYIHRHSLFDKTDRLFIKETTSFIDSIYDIFNLENELSTKKLLIDFLVDLCINIKYFKVPYHFFYDRFSPFSQQIKKDHVIIYETLVKSIRDFGKRVAIDFSLYEHHLIYLFIITLPAILESNFNYSFLVISNYSKDHSEFMASMIQKQLTLNPLHFDKNICIHLEDLNKYNLNDFELIITNMDLNIDDSEYILINDFPTKKDIINIQHSLSSNNLLLGSVNKKG